MKQPTPTAEQPPPVLVQPESDSRLDQLAAEYDRAKAEADAAASRLKDITDGIKTELALSAPGAPLVVLRSAWLATPLRMVATSSWRLDTAKLKALAPEWYAQCAQRTAGWKLERVR